MPKNNNFKYKICVSGAAKFERCGPNIKELAKEVGKEIIRQNGILLTGATDGIPYFAALGAKEENGMVIGFSPAASKLAHLKTYRLPIKNHDLIIYTGFDYAGRNLLLTRAADAVIVVCGRMGTLNEFTIAFEDRKPIGVLSGSGGTAEMIDEIIAESGRGNEAKIVYSSKPKDLIKKVCQLIKSRI